MQDLTSATFVWIQKKVIVTLSIAYALEEPCGNIIARGNCFNSYRWHTICVHNVPPTRAQMSTVLEGSQLFSLNQEKYCAHNVLIDYWLYRVDRFCLRKTLVPSIVYILSNSLIVVCLNMKGSCSVNLGHDLGYLKIGGRIYYVWWPPKITLLHPICLGESEPNHGNFRHTVSKQERS